MATATVTAPAADPTIRESRYSDGHVPLYEDPNFIELDYIEENDWESEDFIDDWEDYFDPQEYFEGRDYQGIFEMMTQSEPIDENELPF